MKAKQIFTLVLLSILLMSQRNAIKNKHNEQKNQAADTIMLYPGFNPFLDFRGEHLGMLIRKDEHHWWFYEQKQTEYNSVQIPLNFYHGKPNLFDDCVYFDLAQQQVSKAFERVNLPTAAASLRFYMDTSKTQNTYVSKIATQVPTTKNIQPYYQPFYFRKYEVSNKEYRDFVNWVRDSIARRLLVKGGFEDDYLKKNWEFNDTYDTAMPPLNWEEKIRWDIGGDYGPCLEELYVPIAQRHWNRREMNPLKLNYLFMQSPAEFGKREINIYPDTACWTTDFNYTYNEPMTNMYFWHPAYDNYPVVGISYWQCMAFLEWKSKQISQEMSRKGKKYKVICQLPSEREWDMASTAELKDNKLNLFGENYFSTCDHTWLTDLRLTYDTSERVLVMRGQDTTASKAIMSPAKTTERSILNYNPAIYAPSRDEYLLELRTSGNYISDGYFHTGPVAMQINGKPYSSVSNRLRKKYEKEHRLSQATNARNKSHYDEQTGIYYLDGNVSEWMREDLDLNWRPMFTKHSWIPVGPMAKEYAALLEKENYYYNHLAVKGKLVRGGNWYDERYTDKFGKNTAGQNLKTFVAPEKSHSTIGFRYVIYVEEVK
jgi:formylglycine-generating enzyme required for sulfatase activity